MLPPQDGALDQSGPLQDLQVLGDSVERNREPLGQAADVGFPLGQDHQDLASSRICNGAIDLVEHLSAHSFRGLRSTVWLNIIIQPTGGMISGQAPSRQPTNPRRRIDMATQSTIQAHHVVSREQWIAERRALLGREKELTHLTDEVSRQRRALPWVRLEQAYSFHGPNGEISLADLFQGRSQLIV